MGVSKKAKSIASWLILLLSSGKPQNLRGACYKRSICCVYMGRQDSRFKIQNSGPLRGVYQGNQLAQRSGMALPY